MRNESWMIGMIVRESVLNRMANGNLEISIRGGWNVGKREGRGCAESSTFIGVVIGKWTKLNEANQ
jgi:hypothetical protein